MKLFLPLVLVFSLSACATGNYVSPIDRLRNISTATVQGYSESVSKFLASGTPDQAIEKAKKAVASSLKDPDSAQFRNVRLKDYLSGKVICGEVNGKNSYGGYVGFSRFVASTESADLWSRDGKYQNVQDASNLGIMLAC